MLMDKASTRANCGSGMLASVLTGKTQKRLSRPGYLARVAQAPVHPGKFLDHIARDVIPKSGQATDSRLQ